jgi:anhydro-N-acetylmuramic acid kinase
MSQSPIYSRAGRDIYLGIMTGTSLDAIDIAACRFGEASEGGLPPGIELIAFHSAQWHPQIRELLMELATSQLVDMNKLTRTHFLLAHEYAKVVEEILDKSKLSSNQIRAIGLHGQTVRHLPTPAPATDGLMPVGATLQLGSGSALAAISGIDVVSDFRSADVALGGQGAPLVPMFDYWFLRSKVINRLIVNIGGIANVTWLPNNALPDDVIAFDSGPGNMLLDSIARRYFNMPFDLNGALARDGKIDDELLAELLSHPYFSMQPPKSTGRELFSEEFLSVIHKRIADGTLSTKDALATLTELTARSISMSIEWTNGKNQPLEIIVSGGGAMNKYLIERLEANAPFARVASSELYGIPVNAKEAIAFAFFAKAFVEDIAIHLPSTTGAIRKATLGSMSCALQQR